MCEEKCGVIRHESAPIYVPLASGQQAYLNLVQTALPEGPAASVLVALNNQGLCTVDDAKVWVSALQELIALAGRDETGKVWA